MNEIKKQKWERIDEIRDVLRDADKCWDLSREETDKLKAEKERLYEEVGFNNE